MLQDTRDTAPAEALECLNGPDGCKGPVEYRWPGYGERYWPRCEHHGEERLAREDEARERYPVLPPSDFDPSFAGERWDEDY